MSKQNTMELVIELHDDGTVEQNWRDLIQTPGSALLQRYLTAALLLAGVVGGPDIAYRILKNCADEWRAVEGQKKRGIEEARERKRLQEAVARDKSKAAS